MKILVLVLALFSTSVLASGKFTIRSYKDTPKTDEHELDLGVGTYEIIPGTDGLLRHTSWTGTGIYTSGKTPQWFKTRQMIEVKVTDNFSAAGGLNFVAEPEIDKGSIGFDANVSYQLWK